MPIFANRTILVTASIVASLFCSTMATAVSPNVIISEIFPRGTGQNFDPYAHDWVELYNQSDESVDMSNWSLQYAAATSGGFTISNLVTFHGGAVIPAKGFFLIELATLNITSTEQPQADMSRIKFQLHPDGGRLALVSSQNAIGSTYTHPSVVDLVGYHSLAISYEGAGPAPMLPAGQLDKSIQRTRNYVSPTDYVVWRDHDNNATDFIVEYKTRSNTQSTTRNHVPVALSAFSLE